MQLQQLLEQTCMPIVTRMLAIFSQNFQLLNKLLVIKTKISEGIQLSLATVIIFMPML